MNEYNITYEPPEGMEKVSLNDRLKDYDKLNNIQMLQKYGIRLVYEIWDYINTVELDKIKKNPDYFHD